MDRFKAPLVILLLGIIVVGLGVLYSKFNGLSSSPKVEILGEQDSYGDQVVQGSTKDQVVQDGLLTSSNFPLKSSNLTVEASGEVIKPGVYQLPVGSRINDLLILAGGFSANADREWVAKNINLAQKLVDGGKVFVPKINNLLNLSNLANSSNLSKEKININSALESELDTLTGIGPATAKKIISGRPYQKIEELLEKKIVSNKVWEGIKEKIIAY